ncbi:unnamed protein product [Cyprideis torosa]|uniref:Uncharacterized protein n=1 Tax=Cyprideis torosa TaxID=163714 RepID=A0A7R8ZKC9_9CRUS|nr:unnamed protein product [Cyprideis torosa]CAG0889077.1 unnamed protein product [Cyprideis torosa]
MPGDIDILSSSPPILGQSPVFSSFLTQNFNNAPRLEHTRNGSRGRIHPSWSTPNFNTIDLNSSSLFMEVMKRAPSPDSLLQDMKPRPACRNNSLPPGGSFKKKVVFADSRGMQLTQVRVMTEPSDCPPLWSPDFIERITGGVQAEPTGRNWVPKFTQPAADYIHFRDLIHNQCVALENVVIKQADEEVFGTIKVMNLTFHKEVFVRVTFDNWSTFEDIGCEYVPSGVEGTPIQQSIDTFRFSFKFPPVHKKNRIEFCVCYRANGKEYWDSNGGLNFVIESDDPKSPPLSPTISTNPLISKVEDAYRVNMDAWSEFASWNHLVNTTPYW